MARPSASTPTSDDANVSIATPAMGAPTASVQKLMHRRISSATWSGSIVDVPSLSVVNACCTFVLELRSGSPRTSYTPARVPVLPTSIASTSGFCASARRVVNMGPPSAGRRPLTLAAGPGRDQRRGRLTEARSG